MNRILLSTVQYHLKFIYKKMILFTIWMLAVLIFHTLYYSEYKNASIIDIYLVSFGGVEIAQLSTVQIFIALLPYIIIAIIVDLYIEQMMGKSAIYSLIRIGSKKIYFTAHFLSLFIIIFVMITIYKSLFLLILFNVYSGMTLSTSLFPENLGTAPIDFWRIALTVFFIQLSGTFAMSFVQLAITYKLKKLSTGFVIVLLIYVLHIALPNVPFFVGQHLVLSKLNILEIDSPFLFLYFSIQMTLTVLIGLYLYFKRQSSITEISERG